jgi:FtsP/CotA-like multicopper oxidase with cupredoxin domain
VQVCEGDTIIVDVQNYFAMFEGVTIHWHGILQRYSPHMDGVGMVTQCPVQSFSTFQYR